MRLSSASFISSGASSWQGTHHDAQTLTSVTAPVKSALAMPGTGAPSRTRPATGGSGVSGTGRPISADGSRDGSPEPSRNRNSAASARNTSSGSSTISRRRRAGAGRRTRRSCGPLDGALGAARDAARLELGERCASARDGRARPSRSAPATTSNGDAIGRDDESRVRTEVHGQRFPARPAPAAASGCARAGAGSRCAWRRDAASRTAA